MKNSVNKISSQHNDLHPEYILDYRKAKPNRFAGQSDEKRVVVVLDPDVSEIFATPDLVNKVLRALVKSMPATSSVDQRRHKRQSAV